MQWRDQEPHLAQLILKEKKRLSDLFDYPISCFVAPSNKITKYCLSQVVKAGLHFSGIVPLIPNVQLDVKSFVNYSKRWFVRAFYKLPYPGVLEYSDHKEINACLLQSYEYLVRMFDFCDKYSLPMVVNVHYWHLRDHPEELDFLRRFIFDYAIPSGGVPSRLSDIIK